jgi:hypothetical protein
MASTADEVKKDVELLERVLMRLAVAQDDQLQKQIQSLLVPVLNKLNSPHEATKQKVLRIFLCIF